MPEDAVNISPRDNDYLLGHEEAEQFLLDAWKHNSLHNSLLFSGIEGIGKATLAYRFARFLRQRNKRRNPVYHHADHRRRGDERADCDDIH